MIVICVSAVLPSRWDTVCSTFFGTQREGACPTPARLSAGIAVDGGRYIHVFGGSGGSVPRNDFWTFDTVAQMWFMDSADWREVYTSWTDPVCSDSSSSLNLVPKPRFNPLVAVDTGGFVIVGGGMCSDYSTNRWNDTVFLKDYWMFGRETRQWMPITALFEQSDDDPSVASNYSSVLYQHKVYIFGGLNNSDPYHLTYMNAMWVVDLNPPQNVDLQNGILNSEPTLRRVLPNPDSPIPPPRADHTAVVAGTRMYVFGGRNENEALGDMWAFDFDTLNWTQIDFSGDAEPPPARFAHVSAVCRGAAADMSDVIIVYGGRGITDFSDDMVYAYSIGQRMWINIDASGFHPPKRIFGSLACGVNGELWLFGGVDELGRVINDFYRMF